MPVAIRRWGDKCFHLVDEEVEDGYILDGHLIRREDVVDRKDLDAPNPKEPQREPLADEPGR